MHLMGKGNPTKEQGREERFIWLRLGKKSDEWIEMKRRPWLNMILEKGCWIEGLIGFKKVAIFN